MTYYAVKAGRKPGIYDTWDECKKQVDGYSGASYKKFKTREEAIGFIGIVSDNNTTSKVEQDNNISNMVNWSGAEPTTHAGNKPRLDIKPNEIIVYTDGSYRDSDKSYGYGAICITPTGEEIELEGRGQDPSVSKLRNVAGEVLAVVYSIHWAIKQGYKKIEVHHDYIGVSEWANGGWKCNNDFTKNYRETIKMFRNKIDVKFVKVKAHAGDYYNEWADRLASK